MRTPSSTRAVKRGQPTGSAISMRIASVIGAPDSAGTRSVRRSGTPSTAATSRATPRWLSASARFGVTFTSSTASSSPSALASGVPGTRSLGRMRSPLASSDSPSSLPEQSIPWLSTPRRLARWMVGPPGSVVPTVASGTRSPTWKFFAPQTT